jgi:hypothetical protein
MTYRKRPMSMGEINRPQDRGVSRPPVVMDIAGAGDGDLSPEDKRQECLGYRKDIVRSSWAMKGWFGATVLSMFGAMGGILWSTAISQREELDSTSELKVTEPIDGLKKYEGFATYIGPLFSAGMLFSALALIGEIQRGSDAMGLYHRNNCQEILPQEKRLSEKMNDRVEEKAKQNSPNKLVITEPALEQGFLDELVMALPALFIGGLLIVGSRATLGFSANLFRFIEAPAVI